MCNPDFQSSAAMAVGPIATEKTLRGGAGLVWNEEVFAWLID